MDCDFPEFSYQYRTVTAATFNGVYGFSEKEFKPRSSFFVSWTDKDKAEKVQDQEVKTSFICGWCCENDIENIINTAISWVYARQVKEKGKPPKFHLLAIKLSDLLSHDFEVEHSSNNSYKGHSVIFKPLTKHVQRIEFFARNSKWVDDGRIMNP